MNGLSLADRGRLLDWYDRQRRDLPWRRSSDPYGVWVSEIMLQQTQVATVERYWLRWMERFPTVADLAGADEQDALSAWQGLGYYRRCRLLMEGAKQVHRTGLPTSLDEWVKVPGIGRYTAGAIGSIAQGLPAPVVDGNVERVYARLRGDAAVGPALTRAAWKWAEVNVDGDRPGDWNQALMELGATVCLPGEPRCEECPLRDACSAYSQQATSAFPTRKPAPRVVDLRHEVWVPVFGERYGIRRIVEGRWWRGMWEFPRADSTHLDQLPLVVGECEREFAGEIRHTVTHHRISLKVYLARLSQEVPTLTWRTLEELSETALPSPQRKAFQLATKNALSCL